MTHRERMLAAMRGQSTDQIPWAPRMDLWYIAQRARKTIPPRFARMNTAQIADELDVGCHAVRADYTLAREPEELALRALGIDNHPDYPFRVELSKFPMEFRREEGLYNTTIHTRAGDVTMRLRMTNQMAVDGISLPFVEKYPICSADDFEPVAQVFEHLKVIPTPLPPTAQTTMSTCRYASLPAFHRADIIPDRSDSLSVVHTALWKTGARRWPSTPPPPSARYIASGHYQAQSPMFVPHAARCTPGSTIIGNSLTP